MILEKKKDIRCAIENLIRIRESATDRPTIRMAKLGLLMLRPCEERNVNEIPCLPHTWAEELCVTKNTVIKYLQTLESYGWIERRRLPMSDSRYKANRRGVRVLYAVRIYPERIHVPQKNRLRYRTRKHA